jgi:Zc3h12a-like Ribonuclease NYN domain
LGEWSGLVEYNPLTAQVRSRREDLDALRKTVSELTLQLGWYDAFDPTAAASLAAVEEANIASLAIQLAELEKTLANTKRRVEGIRSTARLGWNPQHWFSETRSTAKSELALCLADIEKSQADKRLYADEQARALASLTGARETLERYSKFDRDDAMDNLPGLETEIRCRGAELDGLKAREKALDEELEDPRNVLVDIRSQVEGLRSDLEKAERFERKLGKADNSYERMLIHRECEHTFGTGSPSKVIGKVQGKIAGKERSVEKLELRLREIARRGALNVQALVIDGSNLCYEGDKLIGLFALRALCAQLADNFEVTVVFDASIREKLGTPSDDRLQSQLLGVKVHVVASRTGADETILDAAQDPTTFVVSNDRFADFPDKPAVRDDRLIRHEIINDRILVHDLSIDVEFSNRR